MAHSPTPWRSVEVATNSIDILAADDMVVCSITTDEDELSQRNCEDAEIIVRYVNSCAEIVEIAAEIETATTTRRSQQD